MIFEITKVRRNMELLLKDMDTYLPRPPKFPAADKCSSYIYRETKTNMAIEGITIEDAQIEKTILHRDCLALPRPNACRFYQITGNTCKCDVNDADCLHM